MLEAKTEVKNEVKPFLGFTDKTTIKVDCDNMPFRIVKNLAFAVLEMCKLNGFIILKSSKKHYHVVFDRSVSWEDNLSVLGWFSVLSHNPKLKNYHVMQSVKKASTLRVAPKNNKPSPRIVFRYGEQDHQIRDFLKYRKLIKRIYHLMANSNSKHVSIVHNFLNL